LNRTIPNLDLAVNREWWTRVEFAKRRLVSSLLSLGLPVRSREEDPVQGLAFDFLLPQPDAAAVVTGHEDGIITMNLEEADDASRERVRREMGEPYRTLLGHLRHEVGHYYWDRLVEGRPVINEFRRLFGDERADYSQSLARYYAEGPPPNWGNSYVSSYATAHPWEDWAETWAHYLHMRDSIAASGRFGVTIAAGALFEGFDEMALTGEPLAEVQPFLEMFNSWTALSTLANELSRSMGHVDFYPFVLSIPTVQKLFFIHKLCLKERASSKLIPDKPNNQNTGGNSE
jgi:hypothetical protein